LFSAANARDAVSRRLLLRGGRVEFAACMWMLRRVGGLEATSDVLRGVGRRFSSGGRRSSCMCLGKRRAVASRSRRRPHGLTDAIGFCSAEAGSSREGAEAQTDAASPIQHTPPVLYFGGFSTSSQRDYTATRGGWLEAS
jgi:hypothetical protein